MEPATVYQAATGVLAIPLLMKIFRRKKKK
jgi:hypothetical protein